MASNHVTEVRLMSVPLKNDYKHTIYFETSGERDNYFNSKTVFTMGECSYQRREKYISFSRHIEEIDHCNYLSFFNGYGSRRYFAFITKMEYKSDDVTWIYFDVDVMQTYLGEYTIKPSFIEREHVDDDTIGKHTVPEGLEMGEYIVRASEDIEEMLDLWTVVGVTADPDGNEVSNVYDGIYSGVGYVAYPGANGALKLIKKYASSTKVTTDAISSMFMYPSIFIDSVLKNDPTVDDDDVFMSAYVQGKISPHIMGHSLSLNLLQSKKNPSENGESYTIKNNKLLTYPYRYLLVSNNNGASAIYQIEHFEPHPEDGKTIDFEIRACICPGGSIRLVPERYKGELYNEEEGLNLGKFAIGSWASDVYTNWLTQNGVNIGMNMVAGVGQIVGGVAMAVGTGGVGMAVGGGSVVGGVSTIANQLAQIHQMSMTPPQAHGNINCGDVITASKRNTFTFYTMGIKVEYQKIIDGYFNMFGYKVNTVKIPNENHRLNYWFTKTIDVNIVGSFCGEDLQKIKECFNRGITFWKNPDSIGDYSISNPIIGG